MLVSVSARAVAWSDHKYKQNKCIEAATAKVVGRSWVYPGGGLVSVIQIQGEFHMFKKPEPKRTKTKAAIGLAGLTAVLVGIYTAATGGTKKQ